MAFMASFTLPCLYPQVRGITILLSTYDCGIQEESGSQQEGNAPTSVRWAGCPVARLERHPAAYDAQHSGSFSRRTLVGMADQL
jgi:hypothetical protein